MEFYSLHILLNFNSMNVSQKARLTKIFNDLMAMEGPYWHVYYIKLNFIYCHFCKDIKICWNIVTQIYIN